MLQVTYHNEQRELLVDGRREDYDRFIAAVSQALASASEVVLPVENRGATEISSFIVRNGRPPNRVSLEYGRIVFSIAPTLEGQFLSFVVFPDDSQLPDSPVQYHHHYDGLSDDGAHVAPDSLPVVFGLLRV